MPLSTLYVQALAGTINAEDAIPRNMQPFADGHAHPGEMIEPYQDYGEAGIVLGCASRPEDWRNLEMVDDPKGGRFYGVHPWYAGEWSGSVEEMLRSLLSRDPRAGIGEIGLDSHRGDDPACHPSDPARAGRYRTD